MGEDGVLTALFGCCCGASGMGEELYKDWESHPACQQYITTKRIGEGGFSEVHLANDKLTGKEVALKVVFLNKAGLTKDQKKILAGEARLVRMVAHPNIVRCMQVLETRRQQVLVLEYLSGGEMLKQLQRLKRYTEANACQMFKQVVDAVAYLHSLGILHRDIKPENCLLAKPASHYASKNKPVKVKLIDLGMAGLYRPKQPMHGCMGSPGFIAPEVILGEAHSPAMDVYSLGVLLFIMLVGKKPWDAQRNHTLAYAVQCTCEAPGLSDGVFVGLSAPAKQLLMWMLHEDPSRRPSAQQVLKHNWLQQGSVCKAEGDGSTAAAPAPGRMYQHIVQERLQKLSHSRDIMGSAKGLMVLHGSGSRSQAVMFHRAVKAARQQLQQQAMALKASGQIVEGAAPKGLQCGPGSTQTTAAGAAAAGAVELSGTVTASAQQSISSAGAAAAGRGSGSTAEAALACSSAPAASVAANGMHLSSSAFILGAADRSGALERPASTAALAAAAATDGAAGEPPASRRMKCLTAGQLAREDLTRRHSLLFGALQQQQQQPQPLQQPQPQQHQAPRRGSLPDSAEATGRKGRHKHAASESYAWFGSSALQGAAASSAAASTAAAPAPAAAEPIAIDVQQLGLIDIFERGMSAPNVDVALFSPPLGASRAYVGPFRQERAVSISPGALALLDADDRMCLLHAAGTSMEDDDALLLGGGALSWGRRGAADMAASFKANYPMKPIVRSFARFSQSLSRSFGGPKSFRSPPGLNQLASGSYLDTAAAAAATEAHTEPASAQPSVTQATTPAAATAAAAAAAAAVGSAASPSRQQGAASPAAAGPSTAATAAAAATEAVEDLQQVSFMLRKGCDSAAVAATPAAAEGQHVSAAAAAASGAAPSSPLRLKITLAGSRLSSTLVSEEGSVDTQGAFLGGQMSLDSSMVQSLLAANVDARSPTTSVPRPAALTSAPAASATAAAAAAAAAGRVSGEGAWMPLRGPATASAVADVAKISAVAVPQALPAQSAAARVSAGSAGSGNSSRRSGFASSGGAAAAAAAVLDSSHHRDGQSAGGTGDSGLFGAAMQSPTVRAAATAAAARAEEEGIGLPNGLWLQHSASIKSSTVAHILQLLSPLKWSSAAATGASIAAAAEGEAADAGVTSGDTVQLDSAAGSSELLAASSTSPLSLSDNDLSGPFCGRSAAMAADEPPPASAQEAAAGIAEGSVAAADGPQDAAAVGLYSMSGPDSADQQTHDISIIGCIPDVKLTAATQPAAAVAVAAAAASSDNGSAAPDMSPPAAAAASAAASQTVADAAAAAAAAAVGLQSRAVSVPRSVAAAGWGHRSRPPQLWLSPACSGSIRPNNTSSDGGAPAATSHVHGPAGMGLPCTGSSGTGAGEIMIERASSVANSAGEAELYVGSFWSPAGLAGATSSRRQLRGQLGRSGSSLGRLDSLPDSLPGASLSTAAEVAFEGTGLMPPPEAKTVMLDGDDVGAGVGRVRSSSAAGGRESIEMIGGGYTGCQCNCVSADGGEVGLMEGCLPADCSGDNCGGRGAALQQDSTSVLARMQSRAAVGSGYQRHGGPAAKAGSPVAGLQMGGGAGFHPAGGFLGTAAAAASAAAAAAAAEEVWSGKYGWIAKAVVSRSPRSQQPQPQPQFDAFDEPRGEWYFAGTT